MKDCYNYSSDCIFLFENLLHNRSITASSWPAPKLFWALGLFLICSLSLSPTWAQLSTELGIVSLYKDRGEDQDEKNTVVRPAVQGGWRYETSSGLFVGNWLSSGKFGHAIVQIDSFAGYSHSINEDTKLALGYEHTVYPRQGNEHSGEFFLSLEYQNLTLELYRGMSSGKNLRNIYYNIDYLYPLNTRLTVNIGAGYEHYHAAGIKGKLDYRTGLFYELNPSATLSLVFAGANHKHAVDNGIRNNRLILGVNWTY